MALPVNLDAHAQRLARARALHFSESEVPEELLPREVLESWSRCSRAGMLPESSGNVVDPPSKTTLREASERNAELITLAQPVIETVAMSIRDGHSVVALADADGLILRCYGGLDFMSNAERVLLQPGVSWDERCRGTNAIGTALIEAKALEIIGGEHFLSRNDVLTCSAAPLHDPRGRLIGVLDISGHYRSYHPHTLGMVRMAAQMIEQRLFEARFSHALVLAFHPQPEYVGMLGEGLLALSSEGSVLGINAAAQALLGRRRRNLEPGLEFSHLFDQPFGRLIDACRRDPASLARLDARAGANFFARLRGEVGAAATPSARGSASRAAVQPPRPAGPTIDTLSRGDVRMGELAAKLRKVMGRDIPILIQGESGSGKEMLAKAVHASGPRAAGPFVPVNCAAIPETLIEAELFGYQPGAFTGARREGAVGYIQQADGGTLFLDEIGDMPLALQARLLRVLQERCVTPLGAERAIPVDIRLVCATHRNLREEVSAGGFREDLYYRLNGLSVRLPALRDRSDLAAIASDMLHEEAGGRPVRLSKEVLQGFLSYSWPGNLRQLRNVLRVAVALLEPEEDEIGLAHLPDDLTEDMDRPRVAATALDPGADRRNSERLDDIEREAVLRTLAAYGGNRAAAARALGISRTTLYRKLGH